MEGQLSRLLALGIVPLGVAVVWQWQRLRRQARDLAHVRSLLESGNAQTAELRGELELLRDAIDRFLIVSRSDLQGRITFANRKFCEISKYSHDELLGQNHSILNSGHHPKPFFEQMWKTILKGAVWEDDIRNHTKEGVPYWVRAMIMPIADAGGRPQGFLSMRFDITPLKVSLEDQASLLHRLRAANQELQDFAYAISHDLKAPLRGIRAALEWLFTSDHDRPESDVKQVYQLLVNRLNRLEKMIVGLLDLSKISLSDGSNKEWVDIGQLLRECVDLLPIPSHIAVIIRDPFPTLWSERLRLHQIFQNLIGNAVKFSDKAEGLVEVSCADSGDGWTFTVRDNGPGIDGVYFEKIFEIFRTLDASPDHQNTGIGLAIVKKCAEALGGTVAVESSLGLGSQFRVTVPKGPAWVSGANGSEVRQAVDEADAPEPAAKVVDIERV